MGILVALGFWPFLGHRAGLFSDARFLHIAKVTKRLRSCVGMLLQTTISASGLFLSSKDFCSYAFDGIHHTTVTNTGNLAEEVRDICAGGTAFR